MDEVTTEEDRIPVETEVLSGSFVAVEVAVSKLGDYLSMVRLPCTEDLVSMHGVVRVSRVVQINLEIENYPDCYLRVYGITN